MASKILYRSTRDVSPTPRLLTFREVVMEGLSLDGGLFIPTHLPQLPQNFITDWQNLNFKDLAYEIYRLFIDETEIPNQDLKEIVEKSYNTFTHPDVTPVLPLQSETSLYILELFHGPTLAFKDIALQFLGNLFSYFLSKETNTKPLTVLGATSGDTGGAAIYALNSKEKINVYILHPHHRISFIQRAQMCTIEDENINNIAIEGTFDDCQSIVKTLFNNKEVRQEFRLAAVNSINWARILAQISYYFFAYFQLKRERVSFVVPTGNFGNILAGYYAKLLGLPIDRLIIGTNANDILYRFFQSGSYASKTVQPTLSPAMDIQLSSNFERFLWYCYRNVYQSEQKASQEIQNLMTEMQTKKQFKVPEEVLNHAKEVMSAFHCLDQEILETIHHFKQSYILDPHTAVGVSAALEYRKTHKEDVLCCLSTAHPSKFLTAVYKGLNKDFKSELKEEALEKWILESGDIPVPKVFEGILEKKQRFEVLENSPDVVLQFIRQQQQQK